MVGKSEVPSDTSAAPRRGRWRRVAIDLSPLRERDFRLLWSGELFSEIGSNIKPVAVFLPVGAPTHSPAAGCLLGLVQLVPLMAAFLFCGVWVYPYYRRQLFLICPD